jgi:hypothetical protein
LCDDDRLFVAGNGDVERGAGALCPLPKVTFICCRPGFTGLQ